MRSPRVRGRGSRTCHRAFAGLLPARGGWGAPSAVAIAAPAIAKPQRVVSLNQCADELALRLADRNVVASVTWLSQDPLNSEMATVAAASPANHGLAEEALAYRPDLILVGPFTDPATVALLKRVGEPVAEVGMPRTLDEARRQIHDVAAALGERGRGEALIDEVDSALRRAAADPRLPRLRAVVLEPNGVTAGPGSLTDEILARAGLINVAVNSADHQVPLEVLARLDADVLILDRDKSGGPSLAGAILDHPVVRALARRMIVVSLPSRLWTCAGPEIAEAVRRLVAATATARAER